MDKGHEYLCGAGNRLETATRYRVKILRRYEILGDPIPGACREISDIAYSVLLVDRSDTEKRLGPFTVGYFAGDDLAQKANAQLPHLERLRTPLAGGQQQRVVREPGQDQERDDDSTKVSLSTREAYTVTTLIATYWKRDDLDRLLLQIIEFHHDSPEEDIPLNDLKGLNTLVHNKFDSMGNLLELLRERHPDLREFDFPAIRRRLGGLLNKGYTLNAPLAF